LQVPIKFFKKNKIPTQTIRNLWHFWKIWRELAIKQIHHMKHKIIIEKKMKKKWKNFLLAYGSYSSRSLSKIEWLTSCSNSLFSPHPSCPLLFDPSIELVSKNKDNEWKIRGNFSWIEWLNRILIHIFCSDKIHNWSSFFNINNLIIKDGVWCEVSSPNL
jgi:hypothetical protein